MADEIYKGFWINHSRHPILGATLTLSVDHASLLTSLLSFFVTTVIVDGLFKIITFILYFTRPLDAHEPVFLSQAYVALLNSRSPAPPFELLPELFFTRRFLNTSDGRRKAHLLLLPVWALLALKVGGFAIPPLITSGARNELALLQSDSCGFVSSEGQTTSGSISSNELYEVSNARRYANEMYGGEPSLFVRESVLPVDTLPFKATRNTSCPFDERRCHLGPDSAGSPSVCR